MCCVRKRSGLRCPITHKLQVALLSLITGMTGWLRAGVLRIDSSIWEGHEKDCGKRERDCESPWNDERTIAASVGSV